MKYVPNMESGHESVQLRLAGFDITPEARAPEKSAASKDWQMPDTRRRQVKYSAGPRRVGNELGAGRPRAARTAAAAGITVSPILWAVIAVILAEPHLQRIVLLLYLDGSDPVLWRTLSRLLLIVAVVELFDGLQTTLGGVVQVCYIDVTLRPQGN